MYEYFNYYKCIEYGLYKKLKSLKRLTIEQINTFEDDEYKIFLFLFYEYYDILNDYDNNSFNETNINYILSCGNLKMLKYFESRGFTYESNKLNSYFICSACNQNISILKYLLAKGANINYAYNDYRNAYMFAAINNNIKLLKFLEENGINIYYSSKKFNNNAYLHNIQNAKLSTLKYLESRGINIYTKDSYGMNAYFNAVYRGKNIKILEHLESKGFNIYVKDNELLRFLKSSTELLYCNSKRTHKYILKKFNYNYLYNNDKYKNILSHKNNKNKLIYI